MQLALELAVNFFKAGTLGWNSRVLEPTFGTFSIKGVKIAINWLLIPGLGLEHLIYVILKGLLSKTDNTTADRSI